MNPLSIVLLIGVGAWITGSLLFLFRHRGNSSCCGNCSLCRQNCAPRQKNTEKKNTGIRRNGWKVLTVVLLMFFLPLLFLNAIEQDPRIPVDYARTQMYCSRSRWYGNNSPQLLEKLQKQKRKKERLSNEQIVTFLQGPRAWRDGWEWSGEWAEYTINGNSFGGFGCGLCCMANIYNTLAEKQCSPLDMMQLAMDVTWYYPTGSSGAIDWRQIKKVMQYCGMECELSEKTETYGEFVQHMKENDTAIVLICSYEDDTFWKNTPGHYVNLWNYDEQDDTVFLADPGSPENNRSRIPLSYVYQALKTDSDYQILYVSAYENEKNQWQWDENRTDWNQP